MKGDCKVQKNSLKKRITYVSLIVLVAFTNMTISPSYMALGYQSDGAYNLHPGYISGPIVDNGRSERKKIESSVVEHLLYAPDVLDQIDSYEDDMLIYRSGNQVRIYYSESIRLPLEDDRIRVSEIVPCYLDDDLFFTHIIVYTDGSSKTNTIQANELTDYIGRLSSEISEELQTVVKRLGGYDESSVQDRSFTVAPVDDAVVFAERFFTDIGAQNIADEIIKMAEAGGVRLVPFGEPAGDAITVAKVDDPKERAWSIVGGVVISRGYNPDDIEDVFNVYYESYSAGSASFSLGEVDKDGSIKRIIDKMDQSEAAMNDGAIEFSDKGYAYIWKDVANADIKDCEPTIKDIKRIFREVALHDMEKHNKEVLSEEKTGNIMSPEDMPGFDGSKIVIEKLTNTLPPTDITTDDGVIRINENFVKLMHIIGREYLRAPFGRIPYYRDANLFPGKIIGEMYESIIYSLAIHTIRGHFPMGKDGYPFFSADEELAQSERGNSYLYVNTLAMMYYWIMLVERHKFVYPRAKMMIRNYPHIFRKLTPKQRYELPFHLMYIVDNLYNKEASPNLDAELVPTGETKYTVRRVIRRFGNSVSNEGYKGEDEEIAGNEGDIHFKQEALELVYGDIRGIEDKEIVETERYIRTVFRNVAMHEIIDHNDSVTEDKYKVREEDVPGMDPGKIRFEEMPGGHMIPSDLTTKDGTIRINKNFVKMMHIFLTNPDNTEVGKEFAEVGKSIIYSLAIHTIRGHFEIVPQGFVRFVRAEKSAQASRGRKYLYQNILGTMYYWIMVVERDPYPHWRLASFMEENPEVFANLTPGQRRSLPRDLRALVDKFDRAGLFRKDDLYYSTHMTMEDYKKIMKTYPGAVSNEGDPFKFFALEDIASSKENFLILYKNIMFAEDRFTPETLSEKMGGLNKEITKAYLDAFSEAGIVELVAADEGIVYQVNKFDPKESAAISEIIMGIDEYSPERIAKAKGRLLKVTELRCADIFMQEVIEAAESKDERESGQKIIIAVETDWVKGAQRNYVQEVIKATENLKAKAPVVIVRGSGKSLARELEKAVHDEGVSLKNVVVLASSETLSNDYFESIRAEDDADLNKAFLAEIDASNLSGDSYVRILEMMTMAVRLAFGQRAAGYHPDIEINYINNRTVVFIPRAEPVDYEDLKQIYRNQRKILLAA